MMTLKNAVIRAGLASGFMASSAIAQTTAAQTTAAQTTAAKGESAGEKETTSAPSEKSAEGSSPSSEVEGAPRDAEEAQAIPVAPSKVVCGLDTFEGMEERDARAAAAMICQNLRRYGELVEDHDGEFSEAAEGYRVRAYKLGQRMLVELSHEKPVGTVKTSVRVEIKSVEELVDESERLVVALKEGKPIKKVETFAESAAPPAKKEPGVLMYAGIIGFVTAGDIQASAGGADLGLSIPAHKFSFTPHARLAFGEASLGGLGLDLRYYLTQSENALFLGAGLGAMGIGVSDTDDAASGGGPAGSLLFGVEFNRKERTRVGFNLRADFLAFPLRTDQFDVDDEVARDEELAFVVPVGFNLYLTL
jgi:hypothetical protein